MIFLSPSLKKGRILTSFAHIFCQPSSTLKGNINLGLSAQVLDIVESVHVIVNDIDHAEEATKMCLFVYDLWPSDMLLRRELG